MTALYSYEAAWAVLRRVVRGLNILAGDEIGDSSHGWQGIARDLAADLRRMADLLDAARAGRVIDGPVVFPPLNED